MENHLFIAVAIFILIPVSAVIWAMFSQFGKVWAIRMLFKQKPKKDQEEK
jgi:hypothetical protein